MPDNGDKRPPPDYEGIVAKRWIENFERVTSLLNNNDQGIVKRIKTFAGHFGFEESDVRNAIKNDKMFSAHFAIDPTTQNIHESAAACWLKDELAIKEFIKLPKSGENVHYVTKDGKIILGKKTYMKSLDFRWISNGCTFYATHKYTREEGGGQGNQYKSVQTLLDAFQNVKEEDLEEEDLKVVLLAIVDGPYYTKERFEELRYLTRSNRPYSYALPIEDVPDILNKH